jgi:hypothetical protein
MSHTLEREEVERRLGTTLRAKAAQVVVERPVASETIALAPRRSRRKLVALATAVAVAAAAGGVVLMNRPLTGANNVSTRPGGAGNDNPFPAPLLAPAWAPDGQQLWSLTSLRGSSGPPARATDVAVQLFGTKAGDGSVATGLLLHFWRAQPGASIGTGTAVTVRGQAGVTRPTQYGGEAKTLIEWVEAGADIQVMVRGASVAQAISAIDGLRPRGNADLMQGFDAAADPGQYPMIGEEKPTTAAADEAIFEYAAAAPVGEAKPDITVQTVASGAADPYYVETLAGGAGRAGADGSIVEVLSDNSVVVAWPDGRRVQAWTSAVHPDIAVLEHIASSVTLLDEGAAAALADETQARVAGLPLLGTAHLPSGDLELHGTGTASAVCLRVPGAPVACSNPFAANADVHRAGATVAEPGAGSAMITGQWYVFVGAHAEPTFDIPGGTAFDATGCSPKKVCRITVPPSSASNPPAGETAQIGSTYVALLAVPDGVPYAGISVPSGGSNSIGMTFYRPRV